MSPTDKEFITSFKYPMRDDVERLLRLCKQLQVELDAMTDCAEERRERAKRAEREVEELRHRYEPSYGRKEID